MSEPANMIRGLLPDGSLPQEARAHVDAQVDTRVNQKVPPLVGDTVADAVLPHVAAAKAEADRASGIADAVEEISGLTGEDEAVALLLGSLSSDTRTALVSVLDQLVKVWNRAGSPDRPNVQLGGAINGSTIAPTSIHSVMLQPGGPGYNNIIGGDGSATVGTSTPNTVHPDANNVSVALVGGYDNVAGSIADKIISDHSYTEMGGDGHNAIFGGQGHRIRKTAKHAAIYGGDRCDIGGSYGFATGLLNKVNGQGGSAFGETNTVNGRGSLAAGIGNTAEAGSSYVIGNQCRTIGSWAGAVGEKAVARRSWEHALASGAFVTPGDAQTVRTFFRAQTTSATSVIMGAGGSGLGPQIQPNAAMTFSMQVLAFEPATGDTRAWRVEGTVRRAGAGTINVGSPTITDVGSEPGAAAWTISIPPGGSGYLVVLVQGETGKTIRWAANVTYTELLAS